MVRLGLIRAAWDGEWEVAVTPFAEPLQVAELLAAFERPWCVAGGWAIDLFLGRVTRAHHDVEISILRADQFLLRRHLAGWEFEKAFPGPERRLEPWHEGQWLAVPVHEVRAHRQQGKPQALEIFLTDSSAQEWWYRRNPAIRRPLSLISARSDLGVPFLRPEVVLLYKAKNPREQDEADFQNARERLDEESRAWLRQAIAACHPGHPWLGLL